MVCEVIQHNFCMGLEKDEAFALVALLRACAKNKDLRRGTLLHDDILRKGLLESCSDALVTMYAKCGALAQAKELFDMHQSKNLFTWTTLIAGFVQKDQAHHALAYFEQMQRVGLSPDAVTFTLILRVCSRIRAVRTGEKVHDEISKLGMLQKNIALGNALVNMYAKCGALVKARQALEDLPARNIISWNALMAGYTQHGEGEQALNCLEGMQREGLSPDAVTFNCMLQACGSLGAADKGEKIHDEIAKQGLLGDNVVLGNALVNMYVRFGALVKAQEVLEKLTVRNVISWNSLITGYIQQGEGEQALKCFEGMQREGVSPNEVTYICILKACGSIRALDKGEKIHNEISEQGMLGKDIVLGTALVDMYAKCGALAKSRRVLDELHVRDVVAWNALITGYAQQGEGMQALDCYERMRRETLSPDAVTFICILKACGSIGAVDMGEKIHEDICEQGLLKNDIVVGTALVDMYCKCNAVTKARHVLRGLPVRNVISWNALLAGYVQQGQAKLALNAFEEMQHEGLSPDAATFSCVLSACSRLALVEVAQMHFVDMITKHSIRPNLEHYTCMVDMFGRAGYLDKAVDMMEKTPSSDIGVWSALLGACRKWGDVNIGRWAFEHAVQVDKSDAGVYVLMANMYAMAGMQEDADIIDAMRIKNQECKEPAQSL